MSRAKARDQRAPGDFYQTPQALADAMAVRLPEPGLDPKTHEPCLSFGLRVLDPCAGNGVFGRSIRTFRPKATLHEIDVSPQGPGIEMLDFFSLGCTEGRIFDVIIGNPPYSLAEQFIRHALSLAPEVHFLLRLNFLEGQKRRAFWKEHPVSHVAVLSRRPSFTGKGTDATAYAVFVWKPRLTRAAAPATLTHLDW